MLDLVWGVFSAVCGSLWEKSQPQGDGPSAACCCCHRVSNKPQNTTQSLHGWMFFSVSPAVERTTDKDKTFKVSEPHLIIAVCHKSDLNTWCIKQFMYLQWRKQMFTTTTCPLLLCGDRHQLAICICICIMFHKSKKCFTMNTNFLFSKNTSLLKVWEDVGW